LTPETEARLREAHQLGLQRILSFEANGGGFGWYGGREANAILTAYAAMFLHDLSRVFDFDRAVLNRTFAWLERAQDPQGRWVGQEGHSTWQRLSNSAIPSAAYVAWAFRASGREDTIPYQRARTFLLQAAVDDAYALALVANAVPEKAVLDRLAKMSKDGVWTTGLQTWNRARGSAADIETTALAVLALARHDAALADLGATHLVRSKDPYGSWHSTQATVLALKALSAVGGGGKGKVAARLWVNGREIEKAFPESDQPQSFDISPFVRPGANEVVIETTDRAGAQVSGRYYVPWGTDDLLRGTEGLNLHVAYDRLEAKVGDAVTCTVKVEADAFMVIAEVSIPPGFTVDPGDLDDLVRRKVVDKYAQTGRALTFYLPGKSATFSYKLKPRYPAAVAIPRSVVYEYYAPDRRAISPPQQMAVSGP
jgi:uncharacterized protein YfaS (alpha-2-macroglobulin family)